MRHNPMVIAPVALFALLFSSACGQSEDPQAIQQRVELQRFTSCQQLESYIKSTATRHMSLQLERDIENQRKYKDNIALPGMNSMDAGAAAPDPTSPETGSKESGPSAHTTTNTQEKDVDEPDFIKNDGKRIFVLSNKKLYTAKSWPPSALAMAGQLKIEGTPTQMFLAKDKIVIFSSVSTTQIKSSGSCMWGGCSSTNATKVTVVDVSDLAAPRDLESIWLPGSLRSARRVGSAVRIVLADNFRWPAEMRWSPKYDQELYEDIYRLEAAYKQLIRANANLIKAQPLSHWLPVAKAKTGTGGLVEVSYRCEDFYHSNASVRLGLASVVSLNLDKLGAPPQRTSIVGGVDQIYASKSSLYLAGQHWWWRSFSAQRSHTYFHKFDITDPNKAKYVASGGVEGTLLNQFSMDEHRNYFRVATTASVEAEDGEASTNWSGQTTTVNRVSVLAEKSGRLNLIGETKDLARGERIYSVRFMGDRGYVVTFRQVDPLFTLDLRKPTKPVVVGELKVPGFSTYIHPLDQNHLLTIGVHQPDPADGAPWSDRSMKLTIFDVTDFAHPKEKFTQKVGTAHGWSDAAYEHKAFNYFAARGLLAIPFTDYTYNYSSGDYWSSFISEVRVYDINTVKGITSLGALSLRDVFVKKNSYSWNSYYSPWIRRSIMAADDSGNDYVYAISDVGIRVAKVSALDTPISTALFQ
jgi:uncharacterized secreted protein with C-terminal beta-propeller domain